MTGMIRRVLQAGHLNKGLLLVVFVALLANTFLSHQAAAGGPIMTGKSYIQGTDRATGVGYGDPRGWSNNTDPRTLRVYPGDKVTFYYYIANWDPIPLISGNVAIEYHSVDFTGNDKTLYSEPSRPYFNIIPGLPSGYWYGRTSTVTVAGPGTDTPGKQFCEYVQTNPTVYDYLDPTAFGTGGVVLGLHKFNTNPDYITIPLPIITQLGGSFYLGGVMSCAEIAYNYDLTPSITPGDKTDSTIAVSPVVTSAPQPPGTATTYTLPTQWQITQFFATPGDVPASLTGNTSTSSSDPCTYLKSVIGKNKVVNCSVPTQANGQPLAQSNGQDTIFDRTGARDPSKGGSAFPTSLQLPSAPNPNLQICYLLSVNTYQPYLPNPSWRNSKVVCQSPAAPTHPKVQILGDDLRAGGQIITSAPAGVGTAFGSWAAYASYAGSLTNNFATAAGLAGGKPSGSFSPQAINALTFANTQATFGSFADATAILGNVSGIQGYFTGLTSSQQTITGTQDISNSNFGGTKPYLNPNQSSPLLLKANSGSSMTIAKGKTIIIVSKAPVEIASDIIYASDTLNSPGDIPQVVIVAPSITIDASVQQVDAWLVTDITNTNDASANPAHYINTCKDGTTAPLTSLPTASGLTTGICSNPLTVNGPVITSHLYLYRTAGSDNDDQAAETFANRGDAYLWALNYANTNLGWVTTKQTELPPRF